MARKVPASTERLSSSSEPSDESLWHEVAQTVKPLRRRKTAAKSTKASVTLPDPGTAKPVPKRKTASLAPSRPRLPPPASTLAVGETTAVDRRLGERLKRGQLVIDAKLDLHGHVYESGAREVADFVMAAYDRGFRMVLIVTGKGSQSGGEGILRQSLPRWLNTPALRERVLAFSAAQPRHGGTGAFYVLLKRKKQRERA